MVSNYLVDVLVVTYNHEKFIAETIDSILIQKTDFKFRIIIGEDYSIDNTKGVCQKYASEYPDKILLISHSLNKGLVKNYQSVFQASSAKYLAILEGDDYWIDKNKLQKQVDILERMEDVGLVYCGFYSLTNRKYTLFNRSYDLTKSETVFLQVFKSNLIGPLTTMFRRELAVKYFDFNIAINERFKTIDLPLWLDLCFHSKLYYMSDVVAVYRKEKGSLSIANSLSKYAEFQSSILNIRMNYAKKYKVDKKYIASIESEYYYSLMLVAIEFNEFKKAIYYRKMVTPSGPKMYLKYLLSMNIYFILFAKKVRIF